MIYRNTKKLLITLVIIVTCSAVGAILFFKNKESFSMVSSYGTKAETTSTPLSNGSSSIEVIAQDLFIPWEIVFLSDGNLLVTERRGTLKKIGDDPFTIAIDGVEHIGEGGLLGIALHPNFETNRWIYLYYTATTGSGVKNVVAKYALNGSSLTEKIVVVDNIPGASNHNGGRIAFGPDGYLYITTGDAQEEMLSQDTSSLAGKILRVGDDGSIPEDNPFDNAVYSYGHRNPQGLAWDDQGRLWATEHGRSGLRSGFDELNIIEKGANYGWPIIQGDETRDGMRPPVAHSGANDTWAPAGLTFINDQLYFVGLRGQSLYRVSIDSSGGVTAIDRLFHEEYGRLRVITRDEDGNLFIATSNTDGRGELQDGDDKIIKWSQ